MLNLWLGYSTSLSFKQLLNVWVLLSANKNLRETLPTQQVLREFSEICDVLLLRSRTEVSCKASLTVIIDKQVDKNDQFTLSPKVMLYKPSVHTWLAMW